MRSVPTPVAAAISTAIAVVRTPIRGMVSWQPRQRKLVLPDIGASYDYTDQDGENPCRHFLLPFMWSCHV